MRQFRGKESEGVTAEEVPSEDARPETGATSRDEPAHEREEPSLEQAVKPPVEQVEQVVEREEPVVEQAVNPPVEQAESAIEHEEPVIEHAKLVAEVRRLELELERYRAHAQRTSQLFLSVTKYAEWVRENARRDAELTLRKARARAKKLENLTREQVQTEHEVARLQAELSRLQALTDETRTRLYGFLTAGLQALNPDVEVRHGDVPKPELGELQETLRERLTPTSAQPEPERSGADGPPR